MLIAVNRVAGLVLPASTKYLIDDVIGKARADLLLPLVLARGGGDPRAGRHSFALTQLLSKAAQRLIADLRRQVQAHVGRLPVAYYDANKTGTLVSRIMTTSKGVRNLIGTGLVEFAGGLLTAGARARPDAADQPGDDAGDARLGSGVFARRALPRDGHAAPDLPRARQDPRPR